MTICAKAYRVERKLRADPLDNNFVIGVVKHNVFIETNRGEQKLIQRRESHSFDTGLMTLGELVNLFCRLNII